MTENEKALLKRKLKHETGFYKKVMGKMIKRVNDSS